MKHGQDNIRSSTVSGIHKSKMLHLVKHGKDNKKSSTVSGIHKSKMLHPDKKKNRIET
jgi:hypothetical protein